MKGFFNIKNQIIFSKRTQAIAVCFVLVCVLFFAVPQITHAGWITDRVNDAINLILGSIVYLLGQILSLIVGFLIWIAGYNNIIYQPAVIKGWLVMRDVLNVGFIIFMMIIAFGTIFNVERYSYKSMLGKVLLAAILVNFSKTLVGLAIDFAHVFTMMFFNAYKSAAAGNMTEALGLKEMIKFSDPEGGDGLKILGAYLLAIVMLIVAIVTVLVYLLVFVTRIIVLWFLTITSPVFFVMRAVPFGEKYASQWMTEFGKYVPMGPILAFFLWLSFAIMGTSHSTFDSIADNVGDKNVVGGTSVGVSSVGQPVNMLSFIVSIGVLWMALKYAGQTSGIAGKFAGTMMGKLQSAGGKVLKSPLTLAKGIGYKATMSKRGRDALDWVGKTRIPLIGAPARGLMKRLGIQKKTYKTKAKEQIGALADFGAKGTLKKQAELQNPNRLPRLRKFLRRPSTSARYEAAAKEAYHLLDDKHLTDWAKGVSSPDDIKDPEKLRATWNKLLAMGPTGNDSRQKIQAAVKGSSDRRLRAAIDKDKDDNDMFDYTVAPGATGYIRSRNPAFATPTAEKERELKDIEKSQRTWEDSEDFKESKAPAGTSLYRLDADEEATEGMEEGGKKTGGGATSGTGERLRDVTMMAENVIVHDQGKQRLEIGAQEFVQQMQEIESQMNSAQQEVTQAEQQQQSLLERGEGGEALMQAQSAQRQAQEKIQQLEERKKKNEPALRLDKQKWGIAKNQQSLSKDEIAQFLPDLVKQAQSQGMAGPQLQEFENRLRTAESIQIEDTRKAQDKVGGVDAVINQQKLGLDTKNPKLYVDNAMLDSAGMPRAAGGTMRPQDASGEDKQRFDKLLNAMDQRMTAQGYSEAERNMARKGLEQSETVRFVNNDAKLHQGEQGGQEQYATGLEEKMHSMIEQLPEGKMMELWNALGDQKDGVKENLTQEYKGVYGAEPPEEMIADEFLAKSLVNATRYGNKDDTTYQLNDAMKAMIEQSQDQSMGFMKSALKSGTLDPPVIAKKQSGFRYRMDQEQAEQEIEGDASQQGEAPPADQADMSDIADTLQDVGEKVEEVGGVVQRTATAGMKQTKKLSEEERKQAATIAGRQEANEAMRFRRTQAGMRKGQKVTEAGQNKIFEQGAQTAETVQGVNEQVESVASGGNTGEASGDTLQPSSVPTPSSTPDQQPPQTSP